MKKLDRSYKLFLVLLVLLGIIPLISNLKFIFANGATTLPVYTNFEMTEYAILEGTNENISSINLNLPSDTWNVDEIELNFTDIDFARETIVVEEQHYGTIDQNYKRVYHKNGPQRIQGQAIQINLTEPSFIYGIEIYGRNFSSTSGVPLLQIRGYDNINNRPNETVYATTSLNLSSDQGWYIQNFSAPIPLEIGNYFLVMNGSSLPLGEDDPTTKGFLWYYNNNSNPLNLYSSQTITNTANWDVGVQNNPLLFKLIRKVNLPFYPEENNMTIEINNYNYTVSNGTSQGEGYFKDFFNYSPHSTTLNFAIFNNRSGSLIFNLTSKVGINNIFIAPSNVEIKINLNNLWTTTPTIIRNSDNYSVRFNFPLSWQNISVFKDLTNISSSVIINTSDNYIFIPNEIISDGAEWEIEAYSPNILLDINAPKIDYLTGQELRFSILNPIAGNYTFLLIDPSGFEEHRFSKLNPPSDYIFSYEIPSNAVEGSYFAYIFFYNGTDAGVATQEFLITLASSNPSNNPIGVIIGIIAIIGSAVGFSSFIAARKIISKRRASLESILSKCNDIINLEYIIVLETRSGIDIFSQSFTDKQVDTTLISGFLQAIRTFGAEMSEEAKKSRTVKLEYKKSIMLMTEFVNLKLIIIMKDNPSPNFIYLLEDLSYDIYKNYGKNIDDFKGNIKQFRGIKSLVEKHLNISLLYPLRVSMNEKVKLNQAEKEMINKALNFMKENNFDHFYSLYLLPANMCTPNDYKAILNLIQKGIFQPVND